MEHVLIIGGTGCVGIETTHALIQRGVKKVVSLSRGLTPTPAIDGVCYEMGDLLQPECLLPILHKHSITHVIHAAALRTTDCIRDPHRAIQVNLTGTANLLESLRCYGSVQRLVFTSTAAVYSVPLDGSLVDETSITIPLNSYTATKLAAEQLIQCYALNYQLPATILRPQVIYGPSRSDAGSTAGVSRAISSAAFGDKFTIPFAGTTGFHYSKDVGQAHLTALLESPEHFAIYNLPAESMAITTICRILNRSAGANLIDCSERLYPFANGLDSSRFEQAFPGYKTTLFEQAIRPYFAKI